MRRSRVALNEDDMTFAFGPDESSGEGGHRGEPAVIADVARCPLCRAPMQAVQGRRGPFVYCLCSERRKK